MNNTINVGGVNYPVNNSTTYYPDAIIGKYVVELGTSVAQEFASEQAKGFTQQAAAQNLFVRAVRTVEYEDNKNRILNFVYLWTFFENRALLASSLPGYVLGSLLGSWVQGLMVTFAFWCFTSVTDALDINVQYSI